MENIYATIGIFFTLQVINVALSTAKTLIMTRTNQTPERAGASRIGPQLEITRTAGKCIPIQRRHFAQRNPESGDIFCATFPLAILLRLWYNSIRSRGGWLPRHRKAFSKKF